jgi:hypothetical protein
VCFCVAISTMTRFRVVWVTGMLVAMCCWEATHAAADPADTHPPPPERILVPSYLEAAPGTGVVSVTRDAGGQSSQCTLELKVDGRPVALLRTSEGVTLHLAPGKHRFSVTGTESGNVCGPGAPDFPEVQTLQVTVAPEHPVDLRIGFGSTGRIHIAAHPSH